MVYTVDDKDEKKAITLECFIVPCKIIVIELKICTLEIKF